MLEALPPPHQDRRTIMDGFSEQIAMIAVFVWALDETTRLPNTD